MIFTNIRIEPASDNPSLAQRSLDIWSSSFGLAASMAALASPFAFNMALVRLGRAWTGRMFPGREGARKD